MNLKLVLRTYSALRQLTDDESALLTTLRNLNDSEREQLVESLAPTKGTGKGIKKTRKPRAKSAHQQSLSSAIQKAGKGRVGDGDTSPCGYQYPDDSPINPGQLCNMEESYAVHDLTMGYAGYHEFQPGKLPARSARGKSSANGAESSTTASTGIGKEDVSGAAAGASEGD